MAKRKRQRRAKRCSGINPAKQSTLDDAATVFFYPDGTLAADLQKEITGTPGTDHVVAIATGTDWPGYAEDVAKQEAAAVVRRRKKSDKQ